jgi:hypothetical protein
MGSAPSTGAVGPTRASFPRKTQDAQQESGRPLFGRDTSKLGRSIDIRPAGQESCGPCYESG